MKTPKQAFDETVQEQLTKKKAEKIRLEEEKKQAIKEQWEDLGIMEVGR